MAGAMRLTGKNNLPGNDGHDEFKLFLLVRILGAMLARAGRFWTEGGDQ
jgi:hypothetical protein